MNKIQKEYKKAVLITLENIKDNIDDILKKAFKNHTRSIFLNICIEPDKLVKWSYKLELCSNPIMIIHDKEKEGNDKNE